MAYLCKAFTFCIASREWPRKAESEQASKTLSQISRALLKTQEKTTNNPVKLTHCSRTKRNTRLGTKSKGLLHFSLHPAAHRGEMPAREDGRLPCRWTQLISASSSTAKRAEQHRTSRGSGRSTRSCDTAGPFTPATLQDHLHSTVGHFWSDQQ